MKKIFFLHENKIFFKKKIVVFYVGRIFIFYKEKMMSKVDMSKSQQMLKTVVFRID